MGAYFYPVVYDEETGQCGEVSAKEGGYRMLKFLEENFEGNRHYGALLTYLHEHPSQVGYVSDYEYEDLKSENVFDNKAFLTLELDLEIPYDVDEYFTQSNPYWLINVNAEQKVHVDILGSAHWWRIGALALLTRRADCRMGGGDLPDYVFSGTFKKNYEIRGEFPRDYIFNPEIIGSWYGDTILVEKTDLPQYQDYEDITKQVLLIEHFE